MNKKFNFDKNGIEKMVANIAESWDFDEVTGEPRGNGSETITITINNNTIVVPTCANNMNAIEYLLKEMYVSKQTGQATTGNIKSIAESMNELFNRCD